MRNLALIVANIILVVAVTLIVLILFDRYKEKQRTESQPLKMKEVPSKNSGGTGTGNPYRKEIVENYPDPNKEKQSHLTYLQNRAIDLDKQNTKLVQENNQLKNRVILLNESLQNKRETKIVYLEKEVQSGSLLTRVSSLEKENKELRESLNREKQISAYKDKINELRVNSEKKLKEENELIKKQCKPSLSKFNVNPTSKQEVKKVSVKPKVQKVNVKPLPEINQRPTRVDELN